VSIDTQIQALETLAALDEELSRLEGELDVERAQLGGKRGHLDQLDAKLAAIVSSIREMERVRNETVAEVRQMSVQMEASRDKLGRSRTEREVNAAQREVEELRKLYRDREVETQKLNGLIDQARNDQEKISAERSALAAELGANAGETETRLGQLSRQTEASRERRQAAAKSVQPVLYRRYEMIRKRRGSAISHTEKGTCSACHISLPPMMFQTLRRASDFDQCPNCNRIIYFRPDAPVSEPVSGSRGSSEEPKA
jgi:predicted  nucleic acid-binding Zn-ribbon protein